MLELTLKSVLVSAKSFIIEYHGLGIFSDSFLRLEVSDEGAGKVGFQ